MVVEPRSQYSNSSSVSLSHWPSQLTLPCFSFCKMRGSLLHWSPSVIVPRKSLSTRLPAQNRSITAITIQPSVSLILCLFYSSQLISKTLLIAPPSVGVPSESASQAASPLSLNKHLLNCISILTWKTSSEL